MGEGNEAEGSGCLAIIALIGLGLAWGVNKWWTGREAKSEFADWRAQHCELERIDGDKRCYRCRDVLFDIAKHASVEANDRLSRIEERLGGADAIQRGLTVCE